MRYVIMQALAVNSNKWALVRLYDGAYKSPAGYIVGRHDVIRDNLTEEQAAEALELVADIVADTTAEPEERAYIIDRNGELLASYAVDELDPDIYAEQYADAAGFDIDETDGLIPDGCEDFSVKIAESADSVRCWTSRNYMMKGE